jgi:hypothetical protein
MKVAALPVLNEQKHESDALVAERSGHLPAINHGLPINTPTL